ncbi:hypothetical protein ACJJTC_018178 [Scirpophaga incertulas]
MNDLIGTIELPIEMKKTKESFLLCIVKELCSETDSVLTSELKEKVNKIIAVTDLTQYTSLHKLSSADESTSSILGFMQDSSVELTFEEQVDLNQAILDKIYTKLPLLTVELDKLKNGSTNSQQTNVSYKDQKIQLWESLLSKITTIQEQENYKMQLMTEWLDYRVNEVTKFSASSCEFMTLKTEILDTKSKILYLQILHNIFTETNHSIKAYSEIEKDLKESIEETEMKIKEYRTIIDNN